MKKALINGYRGNDYSKFLSLKENIKSSLITKNIIKEKLLKIKNRL